MPLDQHEFYVYHDGPDVFARRRGDPPVRAVRCATPQEAHDLVQRVINPKGLRHDHPGLGGAGFNHPSFQGAISANCRAFVEEALARAADRTEG